MSFPPDTPSHGHQRNAERDQRVIGSPEQRRVPAHVPASVHASQHQIAPDPFSGPSHHDTNLRDVVFEGRTLRLTPNMASMLMQNQDVVPQAGPSVCFPILTRKIMS
jgi:hypothetical protein